MRGGRLKDLLLHSVREIVFGLEDSLVSTLGTITGVAVGTGDRFVILLTGIVLVVVEALSMAAGSYLSSKSAVELFEERRRQDHARVLQERVSDRESLRDMFERKGFSRQEVVVAMEAIGRERRVWLAEIRRMDQRLLPSIGSAPGFSAVVMGVFYLVGGGLTLVPYIVFPISTAVPLAVLLTSATLLFLGVVKAQITGVNKVRSGIEMLVVSLGAAGLGFVFGRLVSEYFGIVPLR